MKIDINIYPHKEDKSRQVLKQIERGFPIVVIGIAVLIVGHLLLFFLAALIQVPYTQFKSQWKRLAPDIAAVDILKKEIAVSKAEKDAYEKLLTHDAMISRVFADLYGALPINIWFSQVTFQGGTVLLVGYVVEWNETSAASVNEFITNLQAATYFSKLYTFLQLKSQKRIVYMGKDITRFELECRRN